MKFIFLLTQDLDSPSGLGRYFPLGKELHRLGHVVSIIALHSNYSELSIKKYKKDGVWIHYVAQMHVKKMGDKKIYYSTIKVIWLSLVATLKLFVNAIRYQSDIIMICKPHPMNSIAGIFAKILNRTRLLYLDVDDYESASGNFSNKFQLNVIKFFEKFVPKVVNKITTNTYYMKDLMISWGIPHAKIIYLPNGVDLDRFSKPSSRELYKLKHRLGITNKKVIGYIGSMSLANHPIDLLLDAFCEIYKTQPNVVLLMVGGGEDFDKIKRLVRKLKIESSTIFVGKVSYEDVYIYYHLCNVTVDPVRDNDACRARAPLKIFESIACGVPVVTDNVGDRSIILGNLNSKLLQLSCENTALANKIITAINDDDLSYQFSKIVKKHLQYYSWENITAHFNNSCLTTRQQNHFYK